MGVTRARNFRAPRSASSDSCPRSFRRTSLETVWNAVSRAAGFSGKQADPAHIEKVLRALSLWEKKDNKIITLSGGMKRRLMIAKAL